jgi:hypothetical protein
MRKRSLAIIAIGFVILVAIAWAVPSRQLKYDYRMRVLIEAKYGDGIDEFKMKDFDGEILGAVCFDVDTSGRVYIYDAIKGDIKVYDANGKYLKTIKALPWIVGEQMLADMGVTPEGDIYLAVESGRMNESIKIFRISGKDGELKRIPAALGHDFAMRDGIPVSSSVWLTANSYGDVYLVDRSSWSTTTLVKGRRVLPAQEQVASLRNGEPSKSGYWIDRKDVPGHKGKLFNSTVVPRAGGVSSSISARGPVTAVDSEGNAYVPTVEQKGEETVFKTEILSSKGQVTGVIDSPTIPSATSSVGKGTRQLFTPDGSAYELIGTLNTVRVYKWERIFSQSGRSRGE